MVTIIGGELDAPSFGLATDFGRLIFNAGTWRKLVVTIKKIRSTIRMSISEMMITAGGWRRLRVVNRISDADFVAVLAAEETFANGFHFYGERFHLFIVVAPGDEGGNGDNQPH